MTLKQQNHLWSFLGLVCLYISIDFWLATQGGDVNLPSPISISVEDNAAAVYGLIMVIPTFFAFLYITAHIANINKKKRLSRFPKPFNLEIDVKNNLDRKIMFFFFFIYLIVPMASIVHMENKMFKGTLFISPTKLKKIKTDQIPFDKEMCISQHGVYGCIIANDFNSHLFNVKPVPSLLSRKFNNVFQYHPFNGCDKAKAKSRCKGITFFPFFQPWLLFLLGLTLFIYWGRLLWFLLKKKK